MGTHPASPVTVIYRAWITSRKTGNRLYARDYGLKAFRLLIRAPRKKR
jgi:hypothetical protein